MHLTNLKQTHSNAITCILHDGLLDFTQFNQTYKEHLMSSSALESFPCAKTLLEKVDFIQRLPINDQQYFYDQCKNHINKATCIEPKNSIFITISIESPLDKALNNLISYYTNTYCKQVCRKFGRSLFSKEEIAAKLWSVVGKLYDKQIHLQLINTEECPIT